MYMASMMFFFLSLVSITSGGASVPPLILSTYPPIPVFPYSLTYTAPYLLSTHIYLISLTFSLGPDEAATVWWVQKFVYDINTIITLFQQSSRTINMVTKLVTYVNTRKMFGIL